MKRHVKEEMNFSIKVIILIIVAKFPQALKEYEEAIKRNPEVAKYYSNMGTALVKLM